MVEIWKELPGFDGKYMLSNHGNLARTRDMVAGRPVSLISKASQDTYAIYTKEGRERLHIRNAVSKLFGLPCGGDGTECKNLECMKCGHNPEIAELRRERIRNEGLSEINGKRLLVLHDGV